MCHLSNVCILLVAVMGTCQAVFYTKSTEVDYPRIGRRSFYTTGNGNNYPRIGRRSSLPNSQTSSLFSADDLAAAAVVAAAAPSQNKRGFYTKADKFRSYPRVGRSQGADVDSLTAEDEGSDGSFLEDDQGLGSAIDRKELRVPLTLLFLAFDDNGDGQLSKSEFLSGMSQYRQRNPLC